MKSWRESSDAIQFYLPALIILIMVALWPLLRTFYFSFTDATLSSLDNYNFIGLENYVYLFQDPDWWMSVGNTLLFVAGSVACETLLGLAFALLLNSQFKGRGLLRAAVLVPWAIPTVVSAKIWAWMFHDIYGVINSVFLSLGILGQPIAWLAQGRETLLAVIMVDIWKTTPFMTLLILAGLQGIPKQIYEVATIDGASALRKFWNITLPMVRPAILVAVIFRTLDALRVFDLPYILTSNSKSTSVMSVYARQQLIDFQDIGYGSAASFLIFVVIGTFTLLYLRYNQANLRLD